MRVNRLRTFGMVFGAAMTASLAFANAVADDANRPNLHPRLAKLLAERGTADLVIEFKKPAPDLSPAFAMSWEERGLWVRDQLEAANVGTHAPVLRYLALRKLRHRSFLVGNLLYVFMGDEEAARWIADLPEVAEVREPITVFLPPIDVDVDGGTLSNDNATWGLKDTGATDFWSQFGVKGEGVVVANIDSGVDYQHPALKARFNCADDPRDPKCWWDPSTICGPAGVCDNDGHGTHTMGTMVGGDDDTLPYAAGMAPGAKWIACKGCEYSWCSEFALNSCADWLLAPGGNPASRPHVVNNSWGGGGGATWYQSKVRAWQASGIFPAFAAGNAGSSCSSLASPGDYQESFSSVAHDSNRTIASFSSRGPSAAFGHEPYTKPNISAPGVAVTSTVPGNGWESWSGTSMASPHTAGAVALLWSCNPALRGQIAQTIDLLHLSAGAAPAGSCGAPPDGQGNYTYGYGFLNVLAAGEAACNGLSFPSIHVEAITPAALCTSRAVRARPLIFSESSQAVSGASVTGTWTRPGGTKTQLTQTTASNGEATLTIRASARGQYTFCVGGVSKQGFIYDAAANLESCDVVNYNCR